jgi:hypothetical protein
MVGLQLVTSEFSACAWAVQSGASSYTLGSWLFTSRVIVPVSSWLMGIDVIARRASGSCAYGPADSQTPPETVKEARADYYWRRAGVSMAAVSATTARSPAPLAERSRADMTAQADGLRHAEKAGKGIRPSQ